MQNVPAIGDVSPAVRRRRWRSRLAVGSVSRGTWIRVGILAVFCAFYVWTSATSVPIHFTPGADGVHGRIADAFLHGRLYLEEASPALTQLSNPYDPQERALIQSDPASVEPRIHDLSLYHDKLYAYWGPVPALLLFAPARLLGVAFSESLAIALFAFGTFLFATLLLLSLQRRFAPRAPAWKVNAAVICLGLANALPCVIRRFAVLAPYQVAITAAACFALLATWLLVTALLAEDAKRQPNLRRLGLASLAMGLAVGSRPSHVITAAGLLLLAAWWLRGIAKPQRTRTAVALLGPVAACGALLCIYNLARFGSPTDFGLRYQLAAVDVTTRHSFSLSYLLPGLWYYLIAPPRLALVFPFFQLPPPPHYPGPTPADYDGVEPTGGLLVLAPIVLVMLTVPFRRRLDAELRAVLLTLLGISAGTVFIVSVAFWGATMRYEVDFASMLLVGALTVWLCSRTRWAAVAGATAIAWASIVGLALSFGSGTSSLRVSHPKLWQSLARDFSPISRVATRVAYGGPAIAEVYGIQAFDRSGQNYATLGDQGISLTLYPGVPVGVVVVMPSAGEAHMKMRAQPGSGAVPGKPLRLLIGQPDGTKGAVEITGDPEIDVSLKLGAGVQQLLLEPWAEAPVPGADLLGVTNLRVEGGS